MEAGVGAGNEEKSLRLTPNKKSAITFVVADCLYPARLLFVLSNFLSFSRSRCFLSCN